METVSTFGEIKNALRQHGDGLADGTFEPLVRELWMQAAGEVPVADVKLECLEEIAVAFVDTLQPASSATERVLRIGRALAEIGEGTERLDGAGLTRLRALVDRAAVELARHVESGRFARRGAWLSFLAHELKNPLNTMLNALWLLRERGSDGPQAARFIELAERAVKKLEERVRDLRGLDQQLGGLPPGWEGRLTVKRR
jgi:signal transduction histidine kinase